MPKEIYVVFNNDSNYEYHFMVKEPWEELEGQFVCLGENTKKHITLFATIKKNENGKTITLASSFQNTQKFCDENSTIFVSYFAKVFIHITTWIVGKKINETSLPDKKMSW